MSSADGLLAAHNIRLRKIDPMVAEAPPLSAPDDDSVSISVSGGDGVARLTRVDPDDFMATWSAGEEHRLLARVSEPMALGSLLERWGEVVRDRATPGAADSEAAVTWPSRDRDVVPYLRADGLIPRTVLAVRPAGRPGPPSPESGVTVRPLTAADTDVAARLWLEEAVWDRAFNGMVERTSTEPRIRERVSEIVSRDQPWSWIAESANRPVGVVMVSPPDRAAWVKPTVAARSVAHVDNMVVSADVRGGGVGAALMREVHRALDGSGVDVTLLHYAALNPLSGPFWHRWGYRPLWTSWARRPANPG
jgi:GNAT superfamily N-acetyltransferase